MEGRFHGSPGHPGDPGHATRPAHPGTPDPTIDGLTEAYREFDARAATEVYRATSSRRFERIAAIPSAENREASKEVFVSLLEEAQRLPAPDPVFSLLKDHFVQFLQGRVSGIDTTYRHPARFVRAEIRFIDFTSRQDSRPAEERLDILRVRLAQNDDVWNGVRTLLPSSSLNKVADVGRACEVLSTVTRNVRRRLSEFYPGVSGAAESELARRLDDLIAKSRLWKTETEKEAARVRVVVSSRDSASRRGVKSGQGVPSGQGPVSGRGAPHDQSDGEIALDYETVLWAELGVKLEDLLEWHEQEIASTRAQLVESAKMTGLGRVESLRDIFDILHKHGGPCDTVEEMFARMVRYVGVARDACKDGYVDLPDEACLVGPTPEQTRDDFPWGGYGGGCWRRRPLIGEMFLNETNHKAVSDGWLKMMAVHECYPGHHAQFVRTTLDTLPKTIKIGSRYVPLMEGAAHRSEKMMEHIYPDPVFRLFVRLRRHHTAVRIKADLYLHYFGRPVEDAVGLYTDELGFDRGSARGQVRYQERNPGYMTCYYYGMKRLADLQARYRMSDKDFTQALFSVGRMSLDAFGMYLALRDSDKARFRTAFAEAGSAG